MGTKNTNSNKVLKVNTNVVKVLMGGTVKNGTMCIKRKLHNYIKSNKIGCNNTVGKPQIKKGTPQTHINQIQKIIKTQLNLFTTQTHPNKYSLTPNQIVKVKNQLITHTVKYLG